MSKRGTYLADSFFILNCSCKIEITVPCDMCGFNKPRTCRSVKIISWTLSMIFGVTASIGRPERDALHVDVRPHLNSFTQLYTVTNAGADVLWTLSNLALISFGIKSFICRCLITARNSFFPFCKKYKGCSL